MRRIDSALCSTPGAWPPARCLPAGTPAFPPARAPGCDALADSLAGRLAKEGAARPVSYAGAQPAPQHAPAPRRCLRCRLPLLTPARGLLAALACAATLSLAALHGGACWSAPTLAGIESARRHLAQGLPPSGPPLSPTCSR